MDEFKTALELVEKKLKELRKQSPPRKYDHNKPAEVEINKFWFENKTIDRIMVVLRSTGCSHYGLNQGCSTCGHYEGTTDTPVTTEEYITQWKSVIDGSSIERNLDFDINDYPVLCLYNLGSFLNPEEVPIEAMKEIFSSIDSLLGIKKTIIESRAEYVTPEVIENIKSVNKGLIEVGIGLESTNPDIRELCHHKNMPNLDVYLEAIRTLHDYDFRALTYVNQKPPFLTEKEAIDDAVETSIFAFNNGSDAVSIEPTSLQAHSLADYLYQIGSYRVPWLWSVIEVVRGVTKELGAGRDLRLGGYFDEEILSGSQGVAPGIERNELFPHTTSGNCANCNERIINAIKEFNKTYNANILYDEQECEYCSPIWNSAITIKDSRRISQRIMDLIRE
ncbi:hypothetical protein KY332_02660 [Candidatus Woesearchaeota archaeon]|nr:hypothetical protein [Candidatus Woesearchaeota archaeon]